MTNEQYHADTSRISKSGLDLIAKSPAHYWAKFLDPNRVKEEQTEAQIVGTATHYAVLEPDKFEKKYIILPEDIDRRTKVGKDLYAAYQQQAAANKQHLIKKEDFDMCLYLRDAVHAHPAAAVLLEAGKAEQTILFDEFQTGAKCKMRPDFISELGVIVDLKTTSDASPAEFGRSSFNYRYHVQAAFYTDGLAYATSQRMGFMFIAVEKQPPYNVAVYDVPEDVINLGRATYLRDLQVYQECLKSGIWHGYGNGESIMNLQFPNYAFKNF